MTNGEKMQPRGRLCSKNWSEKKENKKNNKWQKKRLEKMPKDVIWPNKTKLKRRKNSWRLKKKLHKSLLLNRKKSKKGNVSLKDENASELPGWKKNKDSVTSKMNKNALKNNRKLTRLECVKRKYFKIRKLCFKRKKKRPKSKDRILNKEDCMNSRLEPKKLRKRPNKSSK